MSGLLRCSVVGAVAGGIAGLLLVALPINAGETLTTYSTQALAKLAEKNVIVRDQPQLVISSPPAESRLQTLVLNCEKIEQAQRSLDGALKNGGTFIPVTPARSANEAKRADGVPHARGDEAFHILQNQQRMEALAQKFNCEAR